MRRVHRGHVNTGVKKTRVPWLKVVLGVGLGLFILGNLIMVAHVTDLWSALELDVVEDHLEDVWHVDGEEQGQDRYVAPDRPGVPAKVVAQDPDPRKMWTEPIAREDFCGSLFGNGYTRTLPLCQAQDGTQMLQCTHNDAIRAVECSSSAGLYLDKSKLQVAAGGEPVLEVLGRNEDSEFPVYQMGAFGMDPRCVSSTIPGATSGRSSLPNYLADVFKSMQLDESFQCDTYIDHPVLFLTRYEYANLYHTMGDWYNMYQSLRAHAVDLHNDFQVVFLDGHSEGHLDATWRTMFGAENVHFVSQLPEKTCFRGPVVFVPASYVSPMGVEALHIQEEEERRLGASQLICTGNPYVADFASFVLQQHGLDETSILSEKCGEQRQQQGLEVLIIFRGDYQAHPRLKTIVAARKVVNEAEVVTAVTQLPGIGRVLAVNMESMTMAEQLEAVVRADIVLGFHGAGLSHIVFSSAHTALVEITSRKYKERIHFKYYANWANRPYYVLNAQVANVKEDSYLVDVDVLQKTLLLAIRDVQTSLESCQTSTLSGTEGAAIPASIPAPTPVPIAVPIAVAVAVPPPTAVVGRLDENELEWHTKAFKKWAASAINQCGKIFGNGFNKVIEACENTKVDDAAFIGQVTTVANEANQGVFLKLRNTLLNFEHITVARGGEEIETVRYRGEEEEFPVYAHHAFDVQCGGNGAVAGADRAVKRPNFQSFLYNTIAFDEGSAVVDTCTGANAIVYETPVYFLTRYEYANLYHTMGDWYNLYQQLAMSNAFVATGGDFHIVFLDGHSEGHLDDTWKTLFPGQVSFITEFVEQYGNSAGQLCLRDAVVVSPSYSSALSVNTMTRQTSCPNMPLVHDFRHFFLNAFDIDVTPQHTAPNAPVHVLLILRGYYLSHPRLADAQVSRMITNEPDVEAALRAISGIVLEVVHFEQMSMREQLEAVDRADIMIGVHGAGLSHVLFMRPGTTLIETGPRNYGRPHFEYFAGWAGIDYTMFNRVSNRGQHVEIQPGELVKLVEQKMTYVREQRASKS